VVHQEFDNMNTRFDACEQIREVVPSAPDRIRLGFALVKEGLADMRQEYEVAARQQEARRAVMGDAEPQLRSLSTGAAAARRPRMLNPGQAHGPRRPHGDGQVQFTSGAQPGDRDAIVFVSPVDEQTKASLAFMGLTPRAKIEPRPKTRRWPWSREFDTEIEVVSPPRAR
jgi:hypothetical protein